MKNTSRFTRILDKAKRWLFEDIINKAVDQRCPTVDDLATAYYHGDIAEAIADKIPVEHVASYIKARDVADCIYTSDIAAEIDISSYDVAADMDVYDIAQSIDIKDICDQLDTNDIENTIVRKLSSEIEEEVYLNVMENLSDETRAVILRSLEDDVYKSALNKVLDEMKTRVFRTRFLLNDDEDDQ